jgi:predicted nucleotidyltransferase
MIQKCSLLNVLSVFFLEPTSVHFIREIGRRINLAQTSVRNNIKELEKQGIIKKNKSKPFNGFSANRQSDEFIFYKKVYNFYNTKKIKEAILEITEPKSIILFGSYSRGEDIENSDIDVIIISKVKKNIDLSKLEKELHRKVNFMIIDSLNKLDEPLRKNVQKGWVIYGGYDE